MSSSMSAPVAEPVLIQIKDHAKRHQDQRPPPELVKALKLTPELEKQLYVADTQAYSNGRQIWQLHYSATEPSPELQSYRGVAYMTNPIVRDEIITVCKSYPYEQPVVASEFPVQFSVENNPTAKFSKQRQGFVVRVYCPFGNVNISTHRKIDCAKSRFGQSIYMKEMFQQAAEAKGLDVKKLFPSMTDKRYCHVFFVEHKEMRMIPVVGAPDFDLVYLGSMKQVVANWADADDEDEAGEPIVRDMLPCEPKIPTLEALRPQYYTHEEAQALFMGGVPLVAWVPGQAPTRLVPGSWDRKEQLRGNVPNLKLAYYSLMDELVKQAAERGDNIDDIFLATNEVFKEVLEPEQHSLLLEYQQELERLLDSTEHDHLGNKPAAPGSLIAHLIERYQAFLEADKAGDRDAFLEKAGKATGPVLKTLESYGRKVAPDQRVAKLTKLLRKMCWEQLEAKKVYTLIAEHKRFLSPPAVRQQVDAGAVEAAALPVAASEPAPASAPASEPAPVAASAPASEPAPASAPASEPVEDGWRKQGGGSRQQGRKQGGGRVSWRA
jgi:hypothetical protein